MSHQVCVDASFALKLVLDEADSERVQAQWSDWLAKGVEVIAPYHLLFEATSVIWNHVYRHKISEEAGQSALVAFLAQEIIFQHFDGMMQQAWELARRFGRPTTYDTAYLALAERAGCELWTADGRLVKAVGAALPWVKTPQDL